MYTGCTLLYSACAKEDEVGLAILVYFDSCKHQSKELANHDVIREGEMNEE